MLRIIALICLWIVLVPTASAICVMAGFLAGMFAGWIAMGEPLLCGVIGAIGAVVAIPLALKAMKESLRIPSVFAPTLENQELVTADDNSPALNATLRVAMIALSPLLIATLA